MAMMKPWHKHCGHCGGEMRDDEIALTCTVCGTQAWPQNKTAVAVEVPVWNDDGSLRGHIVTERAIAPVGAKCLVSGFQDFGEAPFITAAREFQEEIFNDHSNSGTFVLNPAQLRLTDVCLSTNNSINIICVAHSGLKYSDVSAVVGDNFVPNSEVSRVWIEPEPIVLGFPIHTRMMRDEHQRLKNRRLIPLDNK